MLYSQNVIKSAILSAQSILLLLMLHGCGNFSASGNSAKPSHGEDQENEYTSSWKDNSLPVPKHDCSACDHVHDHKAVFTPEERADLQTCFQQVGRLLGGLSYYIEEAQLYHPWGCPRCYTINTHSSTQCTACGQGREHTSTFIYEERQALQKGLTALLNRLGEDGEGPGVPFNWFCPYCHQPNRGALTCTSCAQIYDATAEPNTFRNQAVTTRERLIGSLQWTNEYYGSLALPQNWGSGSGWGSPQNNEAVNNASVSTPQTQQNSISISSRWETTDTPPQGGEDKCVCCFELFSDIGANNVCQCPRCKNFLCKECYRGLVKTAQETHVYNYGDDNEAYLCRYRRRANCPHCRESMH